MKWLRRGEAARQECIGRGGSVVSAASSTKVEWYMHSVWLYGQ